MEKDEVIVSEKYPTDLATTLQYAQGFGDIAMRQWAKEHVKVLPNLHDKQLHHKKPDFWWIASMRRFAKEDRELLWRNLRWRFLKPFREVQADDRWSTIHPMRTGI